MSQSPPPLPDAESVSVAPPPLLPSSNSVPAFESARIPGTEGLSNEEIAREIFEGGRFVYYPWCVSLLVVTLRRSSSVRFLRKDQDGFGAALGYSIISLFFGWWGLPWGLIYTPLCIFNSVKGGKDVTQDILNQLSGSTAAAQVLRGAPKRRRSLRMWLLPFMLFGGLFLTPWGILFSDLGDSNRSHDPRYAAFEAADRFISVHKTENAGGNTPEAKQIADKISSQMKSMREVLFTQSKRKSSFSMTDGEFLTWCEIRGNQAVVLIHVPDLRKFNSEAKESLANLAWAIASGNLSKMAGAQGSLKLAVATRGALLYDRLYTGTIRELKEDEEPAEPSGKFASSSEVRERVQELLASESTVAEK